MIREELEAARTTHWRQTGTALLTLEEATTWLEQHPLCLFLPRGAQLPAPAPSFVEACLGQKQAMPTAAAIEQALSLVTRLADAGIAVPLNLLGTMTEQPDFLAHRDALPAVLSLRAERNWKQAPQRTAGHKVSPLVLELWKALERSGSLTTDAARDALGRELTEAAVLRGLGELWQGLRVIPAYAAEGQPTRWELMQQRHREALEAAAASSQVTSLSLLVSMYLQSVYAATAEEIEVFLSPVASRARIREAVRGLAATRQIRSLSMEAQTYFFLEDGLPESLNQKDPKAQKESAEAAAPATERTERFTPRVFTAKPAAEAAPPTAFSRPARPERPNRDRPTSGRIREGAAVRPSRPAARPGRDREQTGGGWKRPERSAAGSERSFDKRPFRPARPAGAPDRPQAGRNDAGITQRRDRSDGRPPASFRERSPFRGKSGPPREARAAGSRPSRFEKPANRSGFGERRRPGQFKDAPSAQQDRPRREDRKEGGRPDRPPRGINPRKSFARDEGPRPEPRRGSEPEDRRGPASARPPRREGFRPDAKPGQKREWRPRPSQRSDQRAEGKDAARASARPFSPKRGPREGGPGFAGKPKFQKRNDRGPQGDRKPRSFRPAAADGSAEGRPSSGKPAFGASGKPAFRQGGKPAFRPSGKPSFRKAGPGESSGEKPPFRGSGKPAGRPSGKPSFRPGGKRPFPPKSRPGNQRSSGPRRNQP